MKLKTAGDAASVLRVPSVAGVTWRYEQHKYERFDVTANMTLDQAVAACRYRAAELALPTLHPAELHYRGVEVSR